MAMDAITPKNDKSRGEPLVRPTVQEAEEAVRTLTRDYVDRVGSVSHRKGGLRGTSLKVIIFLIGIRLNPYKMMSKGYHAYIGVRGWIFS